MLLDKGIAVEGGELRETEEWQQLLRLGPVVDTDTGLQVVDITAAICAELAAAHGAAVAKGLRVPIDYNHGTARGKTAEERRTYGNVTTVEAREDGLYGKLALNTGGRRWVEDNKGNALLSPDIRSGLFDPERKGAKIADLHIRAVSLTEVPRQNRLAEVKLSRGGGGSTPHPSAALLAKFDDDLAVRRFEESLRRAAYALLAAEGYGAPEYLGVRGWQGDESGTVVVSWWGETGGDHMRRMKWARTADGVITCTGPSEAMQAITVYEPISTAAPAATLSRANPPKEVPMPGNMEQPFAVLLARVPDDARAEVANALSGLAKERDDASAKATAAEAEVARLGVQLSAATAKAEGEGKVNAALLARVETLEKSAADKAAAEAAKARAEFLLSGARAGKIGAADAKDQEFWGKQWDLDADNAVALLARMPADKGPVMLSRAPGLDGGVGIDAAAAARDRGNRIATRAKALQDEALSKGSTLDYSMAWSKAEGEVG